jgi:hypothetical protein
MLIAYLRRAQIQTATRPGLPLQEMPRNQRQNFTNFSGSRLGPRNQATINALGVSAVAP